MNIIHPAISQNVFQVYIYCQQPDNHQSQRMIKMILNCRLTLHGVTRPLTVKVRHIGSGSDPWGGFRAGFETAFTIIRSDFGMTHMLGGVGNEVELTVDIEGIRQ